MRVVIAGAGGAAHLPGMVASATVLPVIGVPVPLAHLDGMDSLLSIVQMPAGVPGRHGLDRRGAQRGPARGAHPRRVRPGARAARWSAFQAGLAESVATKDAALAARAHGEAQGESSGSVR